MDDMGFVEQLQAWANTMLVWVGFGTLVGLLAKAIMPGRDPGGAVANLAMGVAGTILGCATISYFLGGVRVTPVSLVGFLVGTAGALLLLLFYRLFRGYRYRVGEPSRRYGPGPYWFRRRRSTRVEL
jgi:uncharacterized membrane protein YeaQ/YmgE (transglycosylase-associated protein family)